MTNESKTTETAQESAGSDSKRIVMRWISVNDELPKLDTHMVLVTRYGATDIAFWRKGKFLEEPMGFEASGVTHWMYLPKHAGA